MYWNANYAIAETKVRHRASVCELISARCLSVILQQMSSLMNHLLC